MNPNHSGPAQLPTLPGNATLIDVRSTNEFMAHHLPGAVHMPLAQLAEDIVHKIPLRATPIILYCASGARSEQGLSLLQALGYTDAHNGGGAVQLANRLHLQLQEGL